MKILATRKQDQNLAALDPWTAVHLGAGLALGLMNVPLRWAVAASATYEVVEQYIERQQWGKELFATSGPESVINAISDVAMMFVGHRLGTWWNRTAPFVEER